MNHELGLSHESAMNRRRAAKARRWVVKIGSALVTNKGRGLDAEAIRGWSEQVTALRQAGCEVVLVSSGAIAEGLSRLQWSKRPHALFELQAAAAVGQMGLIQAYESCFQRHGLHTAQVLLTHDDLAHRNRYLNARTTLRTLLELGVIPVVNENDTVATEKIKLGDNDNLAALVCNLVEADLLVILTDQQGLYNQDPRLNANARLISVARAGDSEILRMAGPSLGHLGRGGMTTKVQAAQRAARSGTMTVITAGSEPQVLMRIRQGDELGTLLVPDQMPLVARKQWLANQLQVRGELLLDEGASRVLRNTGSSLLAVGVTTVRGRFKRGEVVACIDPAGAEVARGLVNYSAEETQKLKGRPSGEIESILGYVDEPELMGRDNLVITG